MLRTFAINSNQIVLSFGVLIAFLSPKQSKIEESSLESMEKQWKAQKHEEPKLWIFKVLCHKQIRNARRGSKEKSAMKQFLMTIMSATFGALPGVQFMYAICCFEAQEVDNPMLQTVHNLELKWMSYSHWKPITSSWRQISHGCEISLRLRNGVLFAAKFCSPLARLRNFPEASRYLRPTFFEIFCFRYLMSKSPNSPCNPPIIGFLSL